LITFRDTERNDSKVTMEKKKKALQLGGRGFATLM